LCGGVTTAAGRASTCLLIFSLVIISRVEDNIIFLVAFNLVETVELQLNRTTSTSGWVFQNQRVRKNNLDIALCVVAWEEHGDLISSHRRRILVARE
jgi:hypothetical protein